MKTERIAAVLLAAGAGSRFGGGKLDAMLDGTRVGAQAWATLGYQPWRGTAIVVPEQVPLFAQETGASLLRNPLSGTGMASSLHCAVGFAQDVGADALLIALADMPFLTADTLARLTAAHGGDAAAITATRYPDGSDGAPSIFGRGCFDALLAITGDRGANAYLAGRDAVSVPVEPAQLRDIDRPSDLS